MKSAKDREHFPYTSKIICYIEVTRAGTVSQIANCKDEISAAYHRALSKKVRIYAVWPASLKSELFEIDNLHLLADAFGVPRRDNHRHEISWSLAGQDDGKSLYAWVNVVFACGCSLTKDNIKKFASDMDQEYGWKVATSKGIRYSVVNHRNIYTISVRRSTL